MYYYIITYICLMKKHTQAIKQTQHNEKFYIKYLNKNSNARATQDRLALNLCLAQSAKPARLRGN